MLITLEDGTIEREEENDVYFSKIEIIPKKKEFKSFTLKEGHPVAAQGNSVFVGCQTFKVQDLLAALRALCREGACEAGNFYAQREGIRYMSYEISWQSADQILTALEEYTKI